MAVVEGWLVITPKKHVYFYSEHGDCEQRALELPWNHLEDETLLKSFIVNFADHFEDTEASALVLPVPDITELKLKAPFDQLTQWFATNLADESLSFASTTPLLAPRMAESKNN